MREALQNEPDTLMVVSSYHIGKERAYLGAAAALGLKVSIWSVHVSSRFIHRSRLAHVVFELLHPFLP